jgi:thioredoxin reductase
MVAVSIVGDGPGGLSAALFLAKNGHRVTVFGDDSSAMHYAYLHNYLGIPETSGTDLQRIARGQAEAYGATMDARRVASVAAAPDGMTLATDDGETHRASYLILSEGKNPELAKALGLEFDGAAITVDRDQRTSLDRVYAVGRATRPTRSQAIISAGAGAVAALDILAREAGEDVQDWDTPPKSP